MSKWIKLYTILGIYVEKAQKLVIPRTFVVLKKTCKKTNKIIFYCFIVFILVISNDCQSSFLGSIRSSNTAPNDWQIVWNTGVFSSRYLPVTRM